MLTFRPALESDADLFYKWAMDKVSRENSYNKDFIPYADHLTWYNQRIQSKDFSFYIFLNEQQEAVGQVRIEKKTAVREAVISISVDEGFRGKGYSRQMLELATADFLTQNPGFVIFAYVFKSNQVSYYNFLKAGFVPVSEEIIKTIPSYILCKK